MSKAKGRRTLNRAKEYYTERGWLVDEVELGGKFRKSRDLFSNEDFGGFDLLGCKRNKTLLIQVKTNRPPRFDGYAEFARRYGGVSLGVESFTWYDRRGPVLHRFLPDGTVKREDLRK